MSTSSPASSWWPAVRKQADVRVTVARFASVALPARVALAPPPHPPARTRAAAQAASASAASARSYVSHSRSRSSMRRIFPVSVFGRSSTNSILRGYAYCDSRSRTNALISAASSSLGS
jgi:hypothetical protein